jgi:cell division protein FtsQ
MPAYQGRALEERRSRARSTGGRGKRILRVLGAFAVVVVLAHLPWDAVRKRIAVVSEIRVDGLHYLDAARVAAASGLARGQDLLGVDCARARQALLLEPRIENATVTRAFPRGVSIRVVERTPVLLVRHGVPWEIDSSGVLLPPLAEGVVADVPLLAGPEFGAWPAGARISSAEVARGLAWARALASNELRLSGQVSEIEVADPDRTALTLMDGTRVISSAWPPSARTLSALRVVIADLKQRGTLAREVDLRFENQVIVRPAESATPDPRIAADVSPASEGTVHR